MKNTQITIDCNNLHEPLKNLQSGNFFIAKNEYGEISLFLYIDNDCIINVETGEDFDTDDFDECEEIKILKKVKITVEE